MFLFVPLLLLVVFGLLPIFGIFYYSFTNWDGISSSYQFVGFSNYIKVLTDPEYLEIFAVSIFYFISGLLQIIVGFYFAVVLAFNTKFSNFFKMFLVIPVLISGVSISMMFLLFYCPEGTFDWLLTILGLQEHLHYWLGDPRLVNYTLASISFWRYMGFSFLLFYGSIFAIPSEYLEAADIDGANLWQKVKYIIIPNLKTVITINFTLLIIGAISVFEIPLIMTGGANGTKTFVIETMNTAFESQLIGLASAMAVIISLVIIGLALLQRKLSKD